MTERIAIIGAGGLAREVEQLLTSSDFIGEYGDLIAGFFCTDNHDDMAALQRRKDINEAVVAIGSPLIRPHAQIAVAEVRPDLKWPWFIHPSSWFDTDRNTIGPGSLIQAGVMATVRVDIGCHVLVNLSCTIGHDCTIGNFSTIAPGCNISGCVDIGQQVLVGTGARILQNITIGNRARIGAGAVVVRDVAPDTTVVGVPARRVPRKEDVCRP